MKRIFTMMALLVAAASFFSCEEKVTDEIGLNADFYITSDKDVIQSNGTDAAVLKVYLKGEDITSQVTIYDGNNNHVSLADGRFTASKDGEYKFWAAYGTYSTFNRDFEDNGLYTIKAISQPVPAAVNDDKPANTSFVHRAFLTQYTGTSCGYCPYMIHIIKQLIADDYIPKKAVIAAAHSGYNSNDEAKIDRPQSPTGSYPYLHVDLVNGFTHDSGKQFLCQLIDNSIASPAKAGISVNPVIYKEEGKIIVTVTIKAAEDGIFNVGAWLLEDNIYSPQLDNDKVESMYDYENGEFDTHHNCVRVVDSGYMGTFFGRLVGPMTAGQTASKTFVMNIDKNWTKKKSMEDLLEDLHLAVFVSYGQKVGSKVAYTVCNAVDVDLDEPTPFEYK